MHYARHGILILINIYGLKFLDRMTLIENIKMPQSWSNLNTDFCGGISEVIQFIFNVLQEKFGFSTCVHMTLIIVSPCL